MKKILSLCILAATCSCAVAFPSFEPFTNAVSSGGTSYNTGATLIAQTNALGDWWNVYNNAKTANPVLTNSTVTTSGLTYSGLPAGGGSNQVLMLAAGGAPQTVMHLGLTVSTNSSSANFRSNVFYSFLIEPGTFPSTASAGASQYIASLMTQNNALGLPPSATSSAQFGATLFVIKNSGSANFGFGYSATTGGPTYESNSNRPINTVYFVVAQYAMPSSNNNGTATLYVNPDSSTFGSNNPPATATLGPFNTGTMTNFAYFNLANVTTKLPPVLFQDVRVGSTWAFVTGGCEFAAQPVASTNINTSSNLVLNVAGTSSGSAISYQWFKGGTALANGASGNGSTLTGSTSPSLTISSINGFDANNYTCSISNTIGSVTSSVSVVTVTDPIITAQPPATQTTPLGQNAVIGLTAIGVPTVTYKWKVGGVNLTDGLDGNGSTISGSSSATLTIATVASADGNTYTCAVTNGQGSTVTSGNSILVVSAADPTITVQPGNLSLNFGATANFNAYASGTATLIYNWARNGVMLTDGSSPSGATITGSTSTNLTIAGVAAADDGTYTLTVTNGLNATTISSNATLTVTDPIIFTQPHNASVNYGATTNFSVSAGGTAPTSYQWQLNGTNLTDGPSVSGAAITGSTTATLTLAGVAFADEASYSVIFTNGNSVSLTSSVAKLTVKDPILLTQPTNATSLAGSITNFSVTASGSGAISYQWRKASTALTDSGDITGSTTATLTFSSVADADAGSYNVQIHGADGTTTTSSTATLTVLDAAAIVSPPLSRVQRVGDHLSFVVVASGTPPITYQWTTNGVIDTSATSTTLSLTNIQLADAGTYEVTVSGSLGSPVSATATLGVQSGLLHLAPTNLVVTRIGDGVETLNLSATGGGATLYVDQYGTNGNYKSTIMIPDNTNSNPQAIIVNGQDSQTGGSAGGLGEAVLASSGNNRFVSFGGYNVSWPWSGAATMNGSAATIVPRAMGTVNGLGYYSMGFRSASTTVGNGIFRSAQVDNTGTSFWTSEGGTSGSTGVIYDTYTNGTTAKSIEVDSGGPGASGNNRVLFGFTNTATGSYDLYVSTGIGSTGIYKFAGAPTNTAVPIQLITDSANVQEFAVSPDGMTIYTAVAPLGNPSVGTMVGSVERWDTNVGNGTWTLTYTNALTNALGAKIGARSLVVDWSNFPGGGSNAVGATVYATTAETNANRLVSAVDSGANWTINTLATAETNTILRSVKFAPTTDPATVATAPQDQTVATGSNAVFTVAAAGSAPFGYQWYNGVTPLTDGLTVNGSTIIGSGTSSLTVSNAAAGDAGSYSVAVSNDISTNSSSAAILTVVDGVSISSGPATQTNNYGDTVTLSVSATGGGTLAYAWKKGNTVLSNGGNVSGSSTAILTLSPVAFSDGATYTAIVSNQVTTNSASGVLTVNDPIIVTPPTPQTAECAGSATFSVVANGSGTLTYQWQLGGTALTDGAGISGSSSSSLNLSGVTLLQSGGQYSVVVTGSESVTSSVVSLTVHDTTPPTVTIIGATTTNVECSSSFTDPGATASDTCDGSTPVTTLGSVNTGATGTYLLTYTSTDSSGNPGAAIRTVVVGDSTPPVITLIGASTTNIECTSSFTDPGATANDGCAGSESVTSSGSVTVGTVGTYLLTYIASDNNGNSATNTRTVNVVDTTAPVVTVNGDVSTVTNECHTAFADPGATANDTCAGSLSVTSSSDLDTNTVGTYTVTYSATDPSTNTGTATLTVIVVDTTPPVITLNGTSPMTVAQPSTYSEPGATANDACAGSVSVSTSGVVDSSTIGTYYVTYIASDPSGNSATNVRTVIVSPLQAPTITIQPTNVTVNAGLNATFIVAATSSELTYQWYKGTNALSDNATFSGTTNAILTISSVLHTNDGSYSVIVTNSSGSATSTNAVLTVIDPAINTQPVSQTNYVGGSATIFSVVAAGTTNLSYQWYSTNTGGHAFAKMTGKTNASLTISPITTTSAGGYEVVVTNHFGSVTSTVAILKDNTPVTITTQPANISLVAGNNATFTVKASGTPPFTYQWNFDGVAIDSATNTSYTVTNAQSPNAGTYTCSVTNVTGTGTNTLSTHGFLTVNPDMTRPAVSLSFPTANLRITNGLPTGSGLTTSTGLQVYLVGGATDNGLVTDVTIQRVAPTLDAAIHPTLTEIAPGKQTFAQLVTLEDGINTYQIISYDSGTNHSTTLTRSVLAVNLQTFTIDITGNGTTVPLGSLIVGPNSYGIPTSGAMLINTHTYQVKAVPDFNNLFTNWTATNGGVLSTNVKYTFTMSSNLTINANFVTNPIIAANMAGAYNGLFYPTNATNVSEENAGFLGNVLVKTNRLYSGKLVVGGISYTLSGAFDLTGNVTQVLSRATHGLSNLLVTMTLEWGDGSQQIRGSVSNIDTANMGNPWNAPLTADLATNTLPVSANLYTMLIPPGTNADGLSPTNAPGGYGYASVTNTPSGIVYVTGALGDGTPLLQEVPMSKDGTFPFYVSLFKNTGVVEGWLGLGTGSPTGSVTMIKPSGVITPATYPSGYTSTATVAGSPYTPGSNPVMSVPTNSTLTVDDSEAGGLGTLTWHVTISNNNALAVISGATNKVTGTFIPQRGIFSIKFQPTGKPASQDKTASGVVLQNTTNAGGWFLGVTNTGSLYLSP